MKSRSMQRVPVNFRTFFVLWTRQSCTVVVVVIVVLEHRKRLMTTHMCNHYRYIAFHVLFLKDFVDTLSVQKLLKLVLNFNRVWLSFFPKVHQKNPLSFQFNSSQ